MTSYFHTVTSFLQMGGYAGYVWSAYAIVVVVLLYNAILSSRKLQKLVTLMRKDNAH